MTPEQKIITIAEWEGWKVAESSRHTGLWALFDPSGKQRGGSWFEPHAAWSQKVRGSPKIPSYLTSRDAICGAVARLDEKQKRIFANMLHDIQLGCDDHSCWYPKTITITVDDVANLILATPAQLADALLLTLGHEISPNG